MKEEAIGQRQGARGEGQDGREDKGKGRNRGTGMMEYWNIGMIGYWGDERGELQRQCTSKLTSLTEQACASGADF